MRARAAEEWAIFLLALQFLTRLPVPTPWTPAGMAAAPRWLPAAGALIGAAAALVYWLAVQVYPPALAALLSAAAGLLLTGALHEDGLADVCDGLGGAADRDRALAIMRDSRIGVFGAAGLGLMLGAKILALGALPPAAVPLTLIAGHAASRAAAVTALASGDYLRPEGAATAMASLAPASLATALGTGALALLATALVLPPAAIAGGLLGLLLAGGAMRATYQRRLGGYTGDCLGAVQQTAETGLYLGVLACL